MRGCTSFFLFVFLYFATSCALVPFARKIAENGQVEYTGDHISMQDCLEVGALGVGSVSFGLFAMREGAVLVAQERAEKELDRKKAEPRQSGA